MGIHDKAAAPAASAQLLDTGDTLPTVAPTTARAGLRLRLPQQTTGADAAPGTEAAERDRHLGPGVPDARRTGGPHGDPAAGAPDDTAYVNQRYAADVFDVGAPDRPRAGSTSKDPARPARMPHAFVLRAFDKWRNPTPGAVPKISQPAPQAAATPAVLHPAATRASRMGNTPDAPTGVLRGPQRNTFRLIPTPWDEQVINPAAAPQAVQATQASRRATGWRAR